MKRKVTDSESQKDVRRRKRNDANIQMGEEEKTMGKVNQPKRRLVREERQKPKKKTKLSKLRNKRGRKSEPEERRIRPPDGASGKPSVQE